VKNEQDKQKARDAIAAYVDRYDAEISMVDLRSFVRCETGIDFAGPTLAALLKPMGFLRDGIRKIDICPGKSTFYVKAAA
jgi:hypothetical protein